MIAEVLSRLQAYWNAKQIEFDLPAIKFDVGPEDVIAQMAPPYCAICPRAEAFAQVPYTATGSDLAPRSRQRQPILTFHIAGKSGDERADRLKQLKVTEDLMNAVLFALQAITPGAYDIRAARWKGGTAGSSGFVVEVDVAFKMFITQPTPYTLAEIKTAVPVEDRS